MSIPSRLNCMKLRLEYNHLMFSSIQMHTNLHMFGTQYIAYTIGIIGQILHCVHNRRCFYSFDTTTTNSCLYLSITEFLLHKDPEIPNSFWLTRNLLQIRLVYISNRLTLLVFDRLNLWPVCGIIAHNNLEWVVDVCCQSFQSIMYF